MVQPRVVSPAMKTPSWLKEPLVHFLLAGGALFVIAGAVQGQSSEGRRIDLSRDDLLVFLLGRAQVYDEASFDSVLDGMNAEDRQSLVRDAALQEALYREGKALGLDSADPLIRQRVVQQMRQLLMEEAAAGLTVSEDEARAYFDANKADYALPASLSFTHVFLAGDNRRAEAQGLLARLRQGQIPADRASSFGERFLYQLNYADVGPALVRSHFGDGFADALFPLAEGSWQGPIQSAHGWHLVLVTDKANAREPGFEDVAEIVTQDALARKRQDAADAALNRMLASYAVSAEGSGE
jgi:parvulin-like peptidyl-prolyl isomerase